MTNLTAAQWARQHITREIPVRLPAGTQAKAKAAGFLLAVIFGGLALLMAWGIIEKLAAGRPVEAGPVVMAAVLIVCMTLLFIFIVRKRKSLIATVNAARIVTRGGKTYSWNNLQSITLNKAMKKNSMSLQTICYLVQFNFTGGQASISSMSPDFPLLLAIAEQIPAARREKTNAMYR